MSYYWNFARWIEFGGFVVCFSGMGLLLVTAPASPGFRWYYLFIGLVPLCAWAISKWVFKPLLVRTLSRPWSERAQQHTNVIRMSSVIAYIVYACSLLIFLLLSVWPYLMILRFFGQY
jgi:hypothetical protein